MNRIQNKFKELKTKKQKALIGFVTAGDPDFSKSLELIIAMCQSGLDILELGVAFSDPTADGPVIQRSSARAIAKGINLAKVFKMIKKIRQYTDIPIVLFSYYNPIFAYGIKKFYVDAKVAGADGTLVVDLPLEESEEMTCVWEDNNFSLIRLIAPVTPEKRMQKIAKTGSGFLYLISRTGITGKKGLNTKLINENVKKLRIICDLPICVGFGISTPDDVAKVASIADGVVIGSAFEKLIEDNIDNPHLFDIMAKKVKEYKACTI